MAKVFSPNKDYTGTSATVDFTQGVGECADPNLLDWFKSKGYTVEADSAELNLLVPEPIEEETEGEPEPIEEEKVEVKPETPKRKTTRTKSE